MSSRKQLLWAALGLILSLCISLGLCMSVYGEDESVWDFDTEYWAVNDYTGAGGDVVVPDTIKDCPVNVLKLSVFNGNADITSITLPEGLELMQESDCSWLDNLTSIHLPESLYVMGQNCLNNDMALTELIIPANVCLIERGCISFNYEMHKVTFEGPCPVIGPETLYYLADDCVIYVPDDQIDAYTETLTAVGVEYPIQGSGQNAKTQEPVYDDGNLEIDGNGVITAYNGYNVRLDIPEELNGTKVTAIGPNAFSWNWYLSYLKLPEGLTTIGETAFEQLNGLKHVKFPSTLKTIEKGAFKNSYYGAILNLPEGLETIGDEAFRNTWVYDTLTLPEGVKTIGDSAFINDISLVNLYLPSTLESIGANAFADTSLEYVSMESPVAPQVDDSAFTNCSNLADIDLNTHCTKAEAQELQSKVDALGLSCYVWRNQNPEVDYIRDNLDAYEQNPDGSGTVLMAGYTGEQSAVRPWDSYTIDGTSYSTSGIADGALKGNQAVTYFAACYNDRFTYVGAEAFADSSLEKVDLFDSVTTIGAGAFRNCTNITELTLPSSITSIGVGAFEGCTGLEKVVIDCSTEVLPEGAFSGCSSLKEVQFQGGVIPARCFESTGIQEFDFADVTAIGDRAFAATSLTEVNIPEQITSIGAGAFAEDALLANVTIPDTVTQIGSGAFDGTAITSFVIPAQLAADASAVPAVDTANIKISDAASDEQVSAWNEALAFPWYDRLTRVSEEPYLKGMPYEASPETDFEFDADNGIITGYKGAGGIVIVPKQIGGVKVTGIGYHSFDSCRDYTDSGMDTNQTDWTKLTGLVIPETVTFMEDSALSFLQQMEFFLCYGPLENTGKSTFQDCRNLKQVVFVNPIKFLDSYLFNNCQALETVWYKGTLDQISMSTFESCFALKQFIVDAKVVENAAFAHCRALEELHFRSTVETLVTNCIADCPAIKTLCIEMRTADGMDAGNGSGGQSENGAVLILPPDLDDNAVQSIYNMWCFGNLGPIQDQSFVKKEACTVPELPEMPTIEALSGISLIS